MRTLRAYCSCTQIILCSYMCVEAFMIASRNGYPVLPCAPFDAKNPPAANLLWLFYISKVHSENRTKIESTATANYVEARGGKEWEWHATPRRTCF